VCTRLQNKKHSENVGPIRHSEPLHAALPFTTCRYCRVARRLRIDVHDDDDNRGDRYGPMEWAQLQHKIANITVVTKSTAKSKETEED